VTVEVVLRAVKTKKVKATIANRVKTEKPSGFLGCDAV